MKTQMLKCMMSSMFLSVFLLVFASVESSLGKTVQLEQSDGGDESTGESQYIRAYFTSKEMAHHALMLFEAEALEISYDENYIVLDATPEDIKVLKSQEFVTTPYPDYDIHHNRSSAPVQEGTIPGYPCYKTVEGAFAIIESLVTVLPDFVTWIDAGDSWEKTENMGGFDLMVLRITNSKIPGPKPKLFVTGGIHAREYTTCELNLRFALYLLENYGKNADVTWMMDYQEFHGMIYANPDGRIHAEDGELWRKNTNLEYCTSDPPKRGCDLNRNFDQNWSSSTDECGQTFSGSSGASEPETQAVQNYFAQEFTDTGVGVYIDLHSYGGIVMNPSVPELETMATKLAYFNGYTKKSYERGMTTNYAYYIVGITSFLYELGTEFFQDCETFDDKILPDNLNSLEYAFRVCRLPQEIPAGPDALEVSYANNIITATIDDEKYGGSSSAQNIAAAEYYVGTPPWGSGATAFPMEAADGSFDSNVEEVTATISREHLPNNAIIYVRGKDDGDNWGSVSAAFSDLTGTSYQTLKPHGAKVTIHYPAPLSLPATIIVNLPQSALTRLSVYSLSGRMVATLANDHLQPGEHAIQWRGKSDAGKALAEGMYLFRLQVGDFDQMERLVLVK